jgi:Trypsin-like peptidase domain
MKTILVALFLVVFSSGIPAQVIPPVSPPAPVAPVPQKPVDFLDHWRRATISLGQVVKDGTVSRFVTQGSGVLVALDAHRGCILTAKHMIVNPNTGMATPHLWMRFPAFDGEQEDPIELSLYNPQGQNIWVTDPDAGDLAIIPLPQQAWARTNLRGVNIKDFADPTIDVFQGATVVVLGYPQIVGEDYLGSPIARSGIIAWVNPASPADKPFLVDANLYNGNSGGPVFRVRNGMDRYGNINLGGGLALLGIVSQGPLQNAPVISADGIVYHQNPITGTQNQEVAIVANVGGIGIIEPASHARKLIEDTFAKIPLPQTPPKP